MRIFTVLIILIALFAGLNSARAEGVFEFYTTTPTATLDKETKEMGKEISKQFGPGTDRTLDIDFAEYQASFNKSVRYGRRLASFGTMDADLDFARSKALFQGLPQQPVSQATAEQRKLLLTRKYEQMAVNGSAESEVFVDMIKISLDSMEHLSRYDLSGFIEDRRSRDKMADLLASDLYQSYLTASTRLAKGWPELASRIKAQADLWAVGRVDPATPLIAMEILEAL